MTLRLRRGTNTQRQSIVFAEGELIYTTDTQEIYVGDGLTLGGILVTNSTLSSPPALLQNLNLNNYDILGTGNISATTISGDGSGLTNVPISSSLSQNLNLNGFDISGIGNISATTISGNGSGLNSVPISATLTQNLDVNNWSIFGTGNITLSGNVFATAFIGDGSGLTNLPTGQGVISGSDYNINIVGNDSTRIIDITNNTITGSFVGDLQGSVFIDNSTTIIDGLTGNVFGTIKGDIETDNIVDIYRSSGEGIKFHLRRGTTESPLNPNNFDTTGLKWASYNSITDAYDDIALLYGYHQTNGSGYMAISAVDSGGNFFNNSIELNGNTNTINMIGSVFAPGGITTSSVVGDLTGSVFADDSSIIIDGTSGDVYAQRMISTSNLFQLTNTNVGVSTEVEVSTIDDRSLLSLSRISDASTLNNPLTPYGSIFFKRQDVVTNNVEVTGVIAGFNNRIIITSDSTGNYPESGYITISEGGLLGIGTEFPNEKLEVYGNALITGTVTAASFKGTFVGDDSTTIVDGINGTITASGYIQFGSYTSVSRPSGVNGMVIYNTTVNRFQGFQNGGWINLDDGTSA